MKNIFPGTFSKDQIPLIEIINLLYLIYKIAINLDLIGLVYLEKIIIFSFLIHSLLVMFQIICIKFTKL